MALVGTTAYQVLHELFLAFSASSTHIVLALSIPFLVHELFIAFSVHLISTLFWLSVFYFCPSFFRFFPFCSHARSLLVQALFDAAKVARGDRVLILGGAGAVGLLAIQLAKSAGSHSSGSMWRETERVCGLFLYFPCHALLSATHRVRNDHVLMWVA